MKVLEGAGRVFERARRKSKVAKGPKKEPETRRWEGRWEGLGKA